MNFSARAQPMRTANAPQDDLSFRVRYIETRSSQSRMVFIFAGVLLALGLVLGVSSSWHTALLYTLGVFLGIVLFHSQFGFARQFRVFLLHANGAGIRAQLGAIALTSVFFATVLYEETIFGLKVHGHVRHITVALMVGAFIFGLGMQIADGCASGTLYDVGSGHWNSIVSLSFFVIGSVIGAVSEPVWGHTWSLGQLSLLRFGPSVAVLIQLLFIALLASLIACYEWHTHGSFFWGDSSNENQKGWTYKLFHGPWAWSVGAVVLAVLQVAIILLTRGPWGVSSGLTLWGCKLLQLFGAKPGAWPYWEHAVNKEEWNLGLMNTPSAVMDIGLIAGAALASALGGRFADHSHLGPSRNSARSRTRVTLGAILGGLCMGFGARLATGCNIGAYFSGTASFSMHGWVWILCALPGTYAGTHLRPFFGVGVLDRSAVGTSSLVPIVESDVDRSGENYDLDELAQLI